MEASSYWNMLMDAVKKMFITQWAGFKWDQICGATLVLEGTKEVGQLLILILSAAEGC